MKLYAISDFHISTNTDKPMDVFGGHWVNYLDKIKADWQEKVSADDIVLIAGDISWAMNIDEAKPDLDFFRELTGRKVFIKGNHDYWWSGIGKVRDIMPENCYALQNDSVRFAEAGVVVCGSRGWAVPGSPDFDEKDRKIYSREIERFKLSLKSAEKLMQNGDKLIAMIHYPPFNVRRESSAFTDIFEEFGVSAVIYGHLHGKNVRADKLVIKNGVKYYLTSCDMVDNKLTEIEL